MISAKISEKVWKAIIDKDEKGLSSQLSRGHLDLSSGQKVWFWVFNLGWSDGLNLLLEKKILGSDSLVNNEKLMIQAQIESYHWATQNLNWSIAPENIHRLWYAHFLKDRPPPSNKDIYESFPLTPALWTAVLEKFLIDPFTYRNLKIPPVEIPEGVVNAFFMLPESQKKIILESVESSGDKSFWADSMKEFQTRILHFQERLERKALDENLPSSQSITSTPRL